MQPPTPEYCKDSFYFGVDVNTAAFTVPSNIHDREIEYAVPWPLTVIIKRLHDLEAEKEEGIFRKPGATSTVARLAGEFGAGHIPTGMNIIHNVGSLLKLFFRELSPSVIRTEIYKEITAAYYSNDDDRLGLVLQALEKMTDPEYNTLYTLFSFLQEVMDNSATTLMSASNLAIVWTPNLVPTTSSFGAESPCIIQWLLEHIDELFPEPRPAFDGWTTALPRFEPTALPGAEETNSPTTTAGSKISDTLPPLVPVAAFFTPGTYYHDSETCMPQDLFGTMIYEYITPDGDVDDRELFSRLISSGLPQDDIPHQNALTLSVCTFPCQKTELFDEKEEDERARRLGIAKINVVERRHHERMAHATLMESTIYQSMQVPVAPDPIAIEIGDTVGDTAEDVSDGEFDVSAAEMEVSDAEVDTSTVHVDQSELDNVYSDTYEPAGPSPESQLRVQHHSDHEHDYEYEYEYEEVERPVPVAVVAAEDDDDASDLPVHSSSDGGMDAFIDRSSVTPPSALADAVALEPLIPAPSARLAERLADYSSAEPCSFADRPFQQCWPEHPDGAEPVFRNPRTDEPYYLDEDGVPYACDVDGYRVDLPTKLVKKILVAVAAAAAANAEPIPVPAVVTCPEAAAAAAAAVHDLWPASLEGLNETNWGEIHAAALEAGFAASPWPVAGEKVDVPLGSFPQVSGATMYEAGWLWPVDFEIQAAANKTKITREYAVPLPVAHIIAALYASDAVHHKGLFRLVGSASTVNQLLASYDRGVLPDLSTMHPDNLGSALKQCMRDLCDRPVTPEVLQSLSSLMDPQYADPLYRHYYMREALASLPDCNYNTLQAIVRFLADLSVHSDTNMMTPSNIGICWVTNLLPVGSAGYSTTAGDVLTYLIENWQHVLPPRCPPPRSVWDELSPYRFQKPAPVLPYNALPLASFVTLDENHEETDLPEMCIASFFTPDEFTHEVIISAIASATDGEGQFTVDESSEFAQTYTMWAHDDEEQPKFKLFGNKKR